MLRKAIDIEERNGLLRVVYMAPAPKHEQTFLG
jgi:hypothetical protein